MSSLRAKLIRSITGFVARRIDVATLDVERTRRFADRVSVLQPTASGVRVEKNSIAGLHAEWLTPAECDAGKLLLYLHGGGYVVGNCNMHRQLVSHIARAAAVRAVLPEYRLAPEHKYPAAVEDATRVYRALLEQGYAADDIVIAGDSAGGGLTMATLLSLRDAKVAMPAAAILLSPFLDVTGSGETMLTRAAQDPWFRPQDLPVIADYYCEPDQQRDPLVSPVFADMSGLPPLLVQVGDDEILLSDAERLHDQITAAGGDIQLTVWPEMWHVFQMFVGKIPEAGKAIDAIGRYVRACWADSKTR